MKINVQYLVASFGLFAVICFSGCAHYNAMQGFPDPGYKVNGQIKSLTASIDTTTTNLASITTKEARNLYIDQRISLADLEYTKYLKYITGVKNGVDAGSKIVVGALGAVGAIAGGGTAQAVSAASAATTAASGAIDVTYFYNQTMPAMISAMNASRKDAFSRITDGKLKEIGDYSVYAAASDLNDYYFAGTLPGAAVSIQNNSSAQTSNANQKIATASVTPSATAKLNAGRTDFTPAEKQALMLRNPQLDLK
jgi:hypothetical protein